MVRLGMWTLVMMRMCILTHWVRRILGRISIMSLRKSID
jgi:hypothetical protein